MFKKTFSDASGRNIVGKYVKMVTFFELLMIEPVLGNAHKKKTDKWDMNFAHASTYIHFQHQKTLGKQKIILKKETQKR